MHYLLFHDEILISNGQDVCWMKKVDVAPLVGTMEAVCVSVVDVDVLLATAVEFPLEKKDSMLVRKFTQLYQQTPYVIQDEKIDSNLFQVIGIKEQKLKEIYSLIPPEKIVSLTPYAIALRHVLKEHMDLNQTVVFVDDGSPSEIFLTVFHGLKFSRSRLIAKTKEDLLPEIKRSAIDFLKKTQAFLNTGKTDFVIVANNRSRADTLKNTQQEIPVEYLPVAFPALEGLKQNTSSIKFRLPQEDLAKQKHLAVQKKIKTWGLSLSLLALGPLYWTWHKVQWDVVHTQWLQVQRRHEHLNEILRQLDKQIYRQDIKGQSLNYAVIYLAMLESIPTSYTVSNFKFYKTDRWYIEMTLLAGQEGAIEPILKAKMLKNADIKDIVINNQFGKYVRVTL